MEIIIAGKTITNISLKLFDNSVNNIEGVLFELGDSQILLTANQDDDTIELSMNQPITDSKFIDIAELKHPIAELLNKKIIWHWTLMNNLGYIDGFQLQVNDQLEFQFIVEASFIRTSKLLKLNSR